MVANDVLTRRDALLISQAELAEEAGVSDTTLSKIEHGRPVSAKSLRKVLDALEMLESQRRGHGTATSQAGSVSEPGDTMSAKSHTETTRDVTVVDKGPGAASGLARVIVRREGLEVESPYSAEIPGDRARALAEIFDALDRQAKREGE